MKIAPMRRLRDTLPGVAGVARLDRRTKRLVGRLNPGDIAIIDHVDLDRLAADALLAARVVGVVNAQPSISGRYPNLGPDLLVANGIVLLDNVGADVFSAVKEGMRVRIDGDTLYVGDQPVAKGTLHDEDTIAALMAEAKAGLSAQLEAFAANTMEYMKRERALLLDGVGVPDIRTRIEGRHALVVVRGYDYKADLQALRPYIREYRPVLIGVDGGADALLEAGYKPHLIVGDMDSVSDKVLRSGAEVVVHAYPDGRAPGLARVQDLGVDAVTFPAMGTSEDIAMLLADEQGRHADRRGRHPRHAGRVPRQGPRRHGVHVPHPLAGRRQAGRRQGRQPALSQPDLCRGVAVAGRGRLHRDRRGVGSLTGGAYLSRSARRQVGPLLFLDSGCFVVISFRYHVVSIVAVFLALALGVVVGTTALNGPITTDLRNKVDSLNKQRASDVQQQQLLQQQVATANQFAGTYALEHRRRHAHRRSGDHDRDAGATSAMKDGVAKEITAAGGTLTGRIQLTSDYTDPKRAGDMLNLADTVHPIGLNLPVTDDAGTARRSADSHTCCPARASRATSARSCPRWRPRRCSRSRAVTCCPARTVVVVSDRHACRRTISVARPNSRS